jgi:phytoene desaturase
LKKVIIIGSGLGGLSTALRLSSKGYDITVLEKHSTPGGRLNIIEQDGFRFDMGPSFMSMTYEFDDLFKSAGVENPLRMKELDPIYQVFMEGRESPFRIFKDLQKLEKEFTGIEDNLAVKLEKYLNKGGEFFHDTEEQVVKSNYKNKLDYFLKLAKVPKKHLPYLYKSMWDELERTFDSDEVKVIFSLVAFFLGSTPFQTPSIYSLLSYTELKNNGYWSVNNGMYSIVREIIKILEERNVNFVYNTEIVEVGNNNGRVVQMIDQNGGNWEADIFISNSDAAAFRGKVLKRENYKQEKLDAMHWTLAPFTIYLGIKGKIKNLIHHNYFLGSNFRDYADNIFTSSISPQKPYYYVNASSISDESCAPEGCENIFILCPVPDLRFKKSWEDKDELANNIIGDLSNRVGYDIQSNILTKKILAPDDWEKMLNLYRGSGLGLAHDLNQVGAFRPKNKDELPMVVISSKLVTERIQNDVGTIH